MEKQKLSIEEIIEVLEAKVKELSGSGQVSSREDHKKRHDNLHKGLDELVADWIKWCKKSPSKCSIMELMDWSFSQTKNPAEEKNNEK